MTRLGFALSMIAVVATAAWAYHVNYRTKTVLGQVDRLRSQIAAEREAVEVLRVEWAYLNAPARLARRHSGDATTVPSAPGSPIARLWSRGSTDASFREHACGLESVALLITE